MHIIPPPPPDFKQAPIAPTNQDAEPSQGICPLDSAEKALANLGGGDRIAGKANADRRREAIRRTPVHRIREQS